MEERDLSAMERARDLMPLLYWEGGGHVLTSEGEWHGIPWRIRCEAEEGDRARVTIFIDGGRHADVSVHAEGLDISTETMEVAGGLLYGGLRAHALARHGRHSLVAPDAG